MDLLLTRKEHDRLCNENSAGILRKLFTNYNRKWSIEGVTFMNVKPEDIAACREATQGEYV